MESRRSSHSTIRQFVHLHPFYSAVGMLSSIGSIALGYEYSPLLLVALQLGKELYNEFKHVKEPPHKVESIFSDAEFKKYKLTLGRLRHHDNEMPLVEVYSSDPHLSAMAQAHLMAPYFPDFHTDYFWYLFTLARMVKGPRSISAIQFINQEIRRRGLDLGPSNIQFHHTLKELYKQLAAYNKKAPFYLKRSDEFNLDYLRAMLTFCEVEKGLGRSNGCSTSILDQERIKYLIRNLDWFTFGSFQDYQIKTIRPTSHFSAEDHLQKPQFVFSSTIIPGVIPAITAYNDQGLGIAYNEVGGRTGNRENPQGGWPGLALTYEIAAEFKTMAEVEQLLGVKQPASPHYLNIVAQDSHGIVQSMPSRMRPVFYIRDRGAPSCVATNHFLDEKGEDVPESACIVGPEVGSIERRQRMVAAISQSSQDAKISPQKIAQSAGSKDTVETLIGYFDYKKGEYRVEINTANAFSPSAPDRKRGEMHYTTVHLTNLFREFKQKASQLPKQLAEKDNLIKEELKADNALIGLMQKSNQVGQSYPALAKELSDFYSALNERLAQCESSPQEAYLSRDTIQLIADQTIEIVDVVLRNAADKTRQVTAYETTLRQKLPKGKLTYDGARLIDALFVACMCLILTQLVANLVQNNSSPQSVAEACDFFSMNSLTFLSARQIGVTIGILSASQCLFKEPKVVEMGEAVVSRLRLMQI